MEVWTALIGGIIIGWLIEWVIDWQYWRRGLDSLYAAEAKLRDALAKSEAEKAAVLTASAQCATQLDDLRSRLETLTRTESGARRSLEAALRETAQLKEQLAVVQGAQPVAAGTSPPQRDPLAKIEGIGPAYEQLLFDAGIHTFAQLAALSADELRAAIRPAAWQKLDFDEWIRAAQELAAQQADAAGDRMP
ncbi:MAG: DUF4332 domain-containing protein [Chloroflexota bacterium]|nr:DUF4332 domain-containing protein [Chloroflexota bacterium]